MVEVAFLIGSKLFRGANINGSSLARNASRNFCRLCNGPFLGPMLSQFDLASVSGKLSD